MITPYLTFNGNCKEALAFYQRVFKSEVKMLQPYGEYIPNGVDIPPESLSEWVLHSEMEICGTNLWFADEAEPGARGNMIKLTAIVPTAKEANEIFERLSDGGNITLPPVVTFYSVFHAALTDKLDVCWNIVAEESPHR